MEKKSFLFLICAVVFCSQLNIVRGAEVKYCSSFFRLGCSPGERCFNNLCISGCDDNYWCDKDTNKRCDIKAKKCLPKGSYLNTCRHCAYVTKDDQADSLSCECKYRDESDPDFPVIRWKSTQMLRTQVKECHKVKKDIANCSGVLTCGDCSSSD